MTARRMRALELTDKGREAIGASRPTTDVPLLDVPWRDDAKDRRANDVRVIVCGGRDYEDVDCVTRVLSMLGPRTVIVHGACPTGADALADDLWPGLVDRFPADWNRHGKAAGPFRNRQMLAAGADVVIAFPGGSGTADMVNIARAAGVPVLEVNR